MLIECVDGGFTDEQTPSASPLNRLSFCPAPPPPTLHQACQDAIDQIEKRNETFKAAVQSPEGDPQEQEVNSGSVFLPRPRMELPASHRNDSSSWLYLGSLEGGACHPSRIIWRDQGKPHTPQHHPTHRNSVPKTPSLARKSFGSLFVQLLPERISGP